LTEKIKQEKPDICFVGGAHAFDIYDAELDCVEDVILEIPENLKEVEREVKYALMNSMSDDELNDSLKDIELIYKIYSLKYAPEFWLNDCEKEKKCNKQILRYYNLIENKFLEPRTRDPDYVGTWSGLETIPIHGFFEMYIDEREGNQIRGRILDAIGDAEFEGEIDKMHIIFTKRYTESFDSSAFDGDIKYHCIEGLGGFEGKFSSPEGDGSFFMKKYSPGIEDEFLKD
jgi:hypothetical protein